MHRSRLDQSGQKAAVVLSSSSRNATSNRGDSGDESDDESDFDFDEDQADDLENASDAMFKEHKGGSAGLGNLYFGDTSLQAELIKAKNREHAKKTRMRKKNYIETLKDDISQTSSLRDAREIERKGVLKRMTDQAVARKQTLSTWFAYRANLETDPAKWREVVEESFVLTIPVTPYRSFPPDEVQDGRRKVVGVAGMIYDTLSLHVLVQSLVSPHSAGSNVPVMIRYEVGQEAILSEDTCMCKWRICTENLTARGAQFEVAKHGMLLATFGAEHKLRAVEVCFDVMSFMQQLHRTAAREGFQVVPNVTYWAPGRSSPESGSRSGSPSSSHSSLSGASTGKDSPSTPLQKPKYWPTLNCTNSWK